MSTTVHVEGISSQTSEKEVRDFFSFCGKISNLSVTSTSNEPSSSKSATVTFEKETAAKTALLLDNTQLGPAQVHVTAAAGLSELAGTTKETETDSHDVAQEDKPRSRIVAEYLAHGYVLSDQVIAKALDLDKTHGISSRFTTALKTFDDKFQATDKAKAADEKLAVTSKANYAWNSFNSYFDKAITTQTGQKLRDFYVQGNKQVMDVHNEARHLANLKSGKTGESSTLPTAEQAGLEVVPGTEKTTCNCGATSEKCPCAPGKCACSKCAKNTEEPTKSG